MIRVFFFGDSICTGYGASVHAGWVSRISAKLQSDFGAEVVVCNVSQNGWTTRQALEAMPYLVQSKHPEILIVQFGLNDCNCWETDGGMPRVSAAAFAANLSEIVDRANMFGTKQVFLNTNHLPEGDEEYRGSAAYYNTMIRRVWRAQGGRLLLNDAEEFFDAEEEPQGLLLDDGVHLSEAGHAAYFGLVFPRIAEAVREVLA